MIKTDKKKSQAIMVWFLPAIVIGGLFWPLLGYIVVLMMGFFLALSYFKGRYWCANLCPRGAFLDIVLSRFSLKGRIPAFVKRPVFKWSVVALFATIVIAQLISAEKTLYAIGFVFVRVCLVTTIFAVVLGLPMYERVWCAFCPMGTLQGKIRSLNKNKQ